MIVVYEGSLLLFLAPLVRLILLPNLLWCFRVQLGLHISQLDELFSCDLGHVAVDVVELPVSHLVDVLMDGNLPSFLVVLVVNDCLLFLNVRSETGLNVSHNLSQLLVS